MTSFASWLTYSSESLHEKVLLGLSPSTALYQYVTKPEKEQPHIAPAIASTAPVISFFNQIRAFIWNDGMIQKGYDQYKGSMFRMPFMGQWATVVSGKYITEIVRAPDTVLSFQESMNDSLQLDLLMGPEIAHNMVHLPVIRMLNRNLSAVYPEILDETRFVLAEKLQKNIDKDGWIAVPAFDTFLDIIGQLTHRAFVGLPLCRDEKWAKVMSRCQNDLAIRSQLLRVFPKSKRPDAAVYLSNYGGAWEEGIKILTPIIEERRNMAGEMPNDLLSWVMGRIPGEEPSPATIINLYLLIDLVAQNTTATTFAHTLFYVAAYPEHTEQLRDEIMEIVAIEGWTRDAIDKMRKVDSFVRETQRLSGISNASINRVALQDFTFSNGVVIPKGNIVQAIGNPLHHDAEIYPEPMEFRPFRFYELAKNAEKGSRKYEMVTPSEEYLTWGRGKHACPGRWFAALVIKHLIAYLIVHYEIKLEDSAKGKRPADWHIAGGVLPNTTAKVMFKKRDDLTVNESAFLR